MTPAVRAIRAAGLDHRLHDLGRASGADGWGREAASALGVAAERVLKTLVVVAPDGAHALALVPASGRLDRKAAARALGVRSIDLAEPAGAQRATGCVVGAISPWGHPRRLRTIIDAAALSHETVFVSGGRRGLEVELSPEDLVALCESAVAELTR